MEESLVLVEVPVSSFEEFDWGKEEVEKGFFEGGILGTMRSFISAHIRLPHSG